jgi:hypothetical protein
VTVDELVGSVRKLRVYRNKWQRASCPSIALLWAIGRAQRGALRLTPWPDTERDPTRLDSVTGPPIGSLRRGTASLGGCDDYQLFLRFNRESSTGAATLVTPTDLAAESPERQVAALRGLALEAPLVDAVTRAVGASMPWTKEQLPKRGETDLLRIVWSACPRFDAELDHLREVL